MARMIRKYAIKNAHEYGSARSENILGKVIKSVDRSQIPELRAEIDSIVQKINAMPRSMIEEEYKSHEKEFNEQYEKKVEDSAKPKMTLDGAVGGNFATRFPPEPGGYMHIGHAENVFLGREFANIYDGRLFLYFDDTNPEKEKQEFVDAFKRDLEWLGISFDKEYYASDSIGRSYDFARKLIADGRAYVCECSIEDMRKMRFDGTECKHRKQSSKINGEKFEKMVRGECDEGSAVVRFAGDMKSLNTTLRDPTIFRIKKHTHYRQGSKYVLWPTYDFNTPINDSLNGVTDVLRSKEYELRDALDYAILDALGLDKPRIHSYARLIIKGNTTHKREIKKLLEEGLISGWDDPRLVTIDALRRRGVQPQAIKEFALRFGVSRSDSVVDMAFLMAENKKLIDPVSRRLFFVGDPIRLVVENAPNATARLKLHPTADMGYRECPTNGRFYISAEDSRDLKVGDVLRLKDLYTIRIKSIADGQVTAEYSNGEPDKKIQWVAENGKIRCSVIIPGNPIAEDGSFNSDSMAMVEGFAESYAAGLAKGDIIQFERFGFAILDMKEEMRFIFISK